MGSQVLEKRKPVSFAERIAILFLAFCLVGLALIAVQGVVSEITKLQDHANNMSQQLRQ